MRKLFRALSRSKKKKLDERFDVGKVRILPALVKGALAYKTAEFAFNKFKGNNNTNTKIKTNTLNQPNIPSSVSNTNKKEDEKKKTKIPFEDQIKNLPPIKKFIKKQDETGEYLEKFRKNEL